MKNKFLQPIDEIKVTFDINKVKPKKRTYFSKTKKNAAMDKVLLKKKPDQANLTPVIQENRYITMGKAAEVIVKDEPLTFHQQLMLDTSIYVNIDEVKKPGTHVYRIEDMIPNPYASTSLNVYDAYLIFKSDSEEEPVRFCKWIGPLASADKKTSSTIWAVGCRALLQVLRTEEYFDSEEIFGLSIDEDVENSFPSAIKPRVDDVFLRVYKIVGKFNPKGILVAPYRASLTSDGVFIVDGGKFIYIWNGFESTLVEKSKAYMIASTIKYSRGGKIEIQVIEDMEETTAFKKVLPSKPESLESLGNLNSGNEINNEEKSENFENTLQVYHSKQNGNSLQSLIMINDYDWFEVAHHSLGYIIDEETEDLMDCQVKEPLSRKDLKTNQCYVLDSTVELYLWIGAKCNKYHIEEAMECFKACMRSQVRPLWMVIGKVFEGFEPELFRLKFPDWYERKDILKIEKSTKSLIQTSSTALYKTIKDMTYTQLSLRKVQLVTLECYKVLDDITCVKCKTGIEGYLNLNESYVFVIVYQIPKVRIASVIEEDEDDLKEEDEMNIQLYYWQSRNVSVIKWSKFLMSSGRDLKEFLETQFHTKSSLERIFAFEEPVLLHQALKFNIKYFSNPADRKKLFKCYIEHSLKSVKMLEVKFEAESLCSRYVYLLLDGHHASLWSGSGASKLEYRIALESANDMIRFLDNEAKASSDIDKMILGKTTLSYFQEKKENDAFWASLKGKKEYGFSNESQTNPFPVVLIFDLIKGLIDCTCVELHVVYTGLPCSILNSEKIIFVDCGVPRPCHLWLGSRVSRQFRNGVYDLLKLRFKEMGDERQIDDVLQNKLTSFSYSQDKLNETVNRSRASSKNSTNIISRVSSIPKMDESEPSRHEVKTIKPDALRKSSSFDKESTKLEKEQNRLSRPEALIKASSPNIARLETLTKSNSGDRTEATLQYQAQQYSNATEGQMSPYAVQRIENLRNIMNMRKKKDVTSKIGLPITLEEEGRESFQFRSYFIIWNDKPDYIKSMPQ